MRSHPVKVSAAGVLLFGAGIAAGAVIMLIAGAKPGNLFCIQKYPLVQHTVDCGQYNDASDRLENIDAAIDAATAQYIAEGKVTKISVWVRDLNSYQWASTDENDRYDPASLLKLPLMIAYYKLAELEPSILTETLTYQIATTSADTPDPLYPPSQVLAAGQSYPVETLIEHMIEYSDNNAADVLASHIDQNLFSNVLLDLGIQIPSSNGTSVHDFVTAKSYAGIFRMLYNASYLNEDFSQQALSLLSKSDFQGIRASVPAGTVVSDKFGERGTVNSDGTETQELHDCGIVYDKDESPYSLCIMTAGSDSAQLLDIIRSITKIVSDKM